jgi:predicted SnoaL-like aldol condensation-catalyzing enzyme
VTRQVTDDLPETDPVTVETVANRSIVDDFVELLYVHRAVRLAFERHVALGYIQHNPSLPDGREAAIELLEPMFSSPSFTKRVLVDANLAAIHIHARPTPDVLGGAVVDIFRLEGGKIVEHWDVLQPWPETSVNPHPMF